MVIISGNLQVQDICIDYIDNPSGSLIRIGKVKKIKALQKINFSLKKGDVMALVGKNGSGKSTLLKTIAGMIRPSHGNIITNGRVILLSGANPGFSIEATGRENITELALAYGVRKQDITNFTHSVIDFADIGDAIDRRIKGYSAGMKGKLGFGFITGLKPDILLIDETLGVGDEEFRKKAQIRLKEFVKNSGSVIMSTHSLGLARELCNRGIVLDNGKLISDSDIEEAMIAYRGILKIN